MTVQWWCPATHPSSPKQRDTTSYRGMSCCHWGFLWLVMTSVYRSVRMGSKHNVRASILASSLSEVAIRIIKIIIINSSSRSTSSFTPVELLTPLGRPAWCSTPPGEPHLWHTSDGQELCLVTLSPWCNMPRLTMANMPISPMWAQTCPGFIN